MRNSPFLSISEVARIYRVPPASVRYAIKTGKLRAIKVGWVWVIRREDLPPTWFFGRGKAVGVQGS